MKRDIELIRQILQEVEAQESCPEGPHELYHASGWQKAYQIALMRDAGLVEADVDTTNCVPSSATVYRLTWAGHDFLDSSRDSKIWKLAKEHVIKPGASWTFSILVEYLKQQARTKIFGDTTSP